MATRELPQQSFFLLLARYLAVVVFGNLVWEIVQLPLYTIWSSGTARELVIAIVYCTLSDILISAGCLAVAVFVLGWSRSQQWSAWLAMVAIPLGIGYTVFSEWLNVAVRKSWAYTSAMPVLPGLGTGLSPLLQWLVVPAIGFWLVRRANRNLIPTAIRGLGLAAALTLGQPDLSLAANVAWILNGHSALRLITMVA
jgi:hypothetical protein